MAQSKTKSIIDPRKFSGERRKVAKEIQKEVEEYMRSTDQGGSPFVPRLSGLLNTKKLDINVYYAASPNEKVIQHNGAFITFGADKPTGGASGYGGKGAMGANRIDLVVGRQSMGKPNDGTNTDNSFQADAARIYISQLTDIDANFGIDPGKSGFMEQRSGIGIKADGVRIIGREGVKIVTGRSTHGNEKNSLGGKMLPAPAIELIAGNNTEPRPAAGTLGAFFGEDEMYDPLQGVGMGNNIVKAFQDLMFLLQDVIGVVRKTKLNQKLLNITIGAAASLPPPIAGPLISAALALYSTKEATTSIDLWRANLDATLFDINYLQPFGFRYIESRNVKTT
jgi:hypothetical protein